VSRKKKNIMSHSAGRGRADSSDENDFLNGNRSHRDPVELAAQMRQHAHAQQLGGGGGRLQGGHPGHPMAAAGMGNVGGYPGLGPSAAAAYYAATAAAANGNPYYSAQQAAAAHHAQVLFGAQSAGARRAHMFQNAAAANFMNNPYAAAVSGFGGSADSYANELFHRQQQHAAQQQVVAAAAQQQADAVTAHYNNPHSTAAHELAAHLEGSHAAAARANAVLAYARLTSTDDPRVTAEEMKLEARMMLHRYGMGIGGSGGRGGDMSALSGEGADVLSNTDIMERYARGSVHDRPISSRMDHSREREPERGMRSKAELLDMLHRTKSTPSPDLTSPSRFHRNLDSGREQERMSHSRAEESNSETSDDDDGIGDLSGKPFAAAELSPQKQSKLKSPRPASATGAGKHIIKSKPQGGSPAKFEQQEQPSSTAVNDAGGANKKKTKAVKKPKDKRADSAIDSEGKIKKTKVKKKSDSGPETDSAKDSPGKEQKSGEDGAPKDQGLPSSQKKASSSSKKKRKNAKGSGNGKRSKKDSLPTISPASTEPWATAHTPLALATDQYWLTELWCFLRSEFIEAWILSGNTNKDG
jgi:hypothetical protein